MKKHRHLISILQAVLVTLLWSSSFIIIKRGLLEIPPVTFAGLRYFCASLFLMPLLTLRKYREELRSLKKSQWISLAVLGLFFYVLTQGIQFIGLSLLPSASVSLMLNFTPIAVVILGVIFLNEKPSGRQLSGVIFFVAGAIIYFIPLETVRSQYPGLLVMALGVVSNAVSSVYGRKINRERTISPYIVTFLSMSTGSVMLLGSGLVLDGLPVISLRTGLSILWMAAVNTAFAFTLWNQTLRHLSAMESSIINSTMLIQIAILARIFLGEQLTPAKIIGMLIATSGVLLVQLRTKQ